LPVEIVMETCLNNLEVSRYHDGELAPERRGEVERHLADCAACSAELAALQGMSRALASAGRAEMSGAFLVRVRQAMSATVSTAREREMRSVLRLAEGLTAMAAMILVVAVVGLKRAGAVEPHPAAWEQAATTLQVDLTQQRQDPTQLAYWSGGEVLP
jgi:anti-sigma factor RsiW